MAAAVAYRSVGELRPGDHAWLDYADDEERRLVMGAYVRDGLAGGEKIVYVTVRDAGELPEALSGSGLGLRPYLTSGRLRLVRWREICPFDADLAPERLRCLLDREIRESAGQGYRNVRITVEMDWALRGGGTRAWALGCDRRLDATVAPSTTSMCICQADRRTGADLDALRGRHEVLVEPDPEFADNVLRLKRIFAPRGLRVEGELGPSRHVVLTEVLTRIGGDGGEIHVDLSGVAAIDAGALRVMSEFAARRGADGRIVLHGPPPHVRALIDDVGRILLPGVTTADD